jgi:hypothetical protein
MLQEAILKCENGLPHDRRLREDGFIILAQSMIRTDGFFVRARPCLHLASPSALRAPTTSNIFGCTASENIERGF